MIILFKCIMVPRSATTLVVMIGVGCNTAHGFGKDVHNAGEGIQNGTK